MTFRDLVGSLLDRAIPTFGEEIEYRPLAGGRYSVLAVFDRESIDIDPSTLAVICSNDPRIGIKISDLVDPPKQGDQVTISGESFTVTDSREDGHGGATLKLSKDDDFVNPA